MSTKRKPPVTLARPALQKDAKVPVKTRIDESRATISKGDSMQATPKSEIIEIESDTTSSYGDVSDSEEEGSEVDVNGDQIDEQTTQQQPTPPETVPLISKSHNDGSDVPNEERREEDEEANDRALTFGDLLRNEEAIDVPATLHHDHGLPNHLALAGRRQDQALRAPAAITTSLGAALNQALRTDDADMLDACLNTSDLATVRATIQRLDSALAGTLLTKLAARLHRRPGRVHSLMGWVQRILVAHGGALAAQPQVTRQLMELGRVLDERARGLNSLLALKGKLDMLEAQMQLRRENRALGRRERLWDEHGAGNDLEDDAEDGEEEGVIYVESDEDEEEDAGAAAATLTNGMPKARRKTRSGSVASDEDGDDSMPLINGTGRDSSEEDEEEDEMDVDGNLIDDEAEESLDEDEVDYDDADEGESGDDDEEEDDSEPEAVAPPPKKPRHGSARHR